MCALLAAILGGEGGVAVVNVCVVAMAAMHVVSSPLL
jgi:hypothetical protein